MGKGRSQPAPTAPDPYKTAQAEAQFNRLDTYSPSGSGVRYGYTNAQGQFVQGTPPPGFQSAVTQVESPWERSIREALQPASVDLTNRVIRDTITNMPNAPRLRDRESVARGLPDAPQIRDIESVARGLPDAPQIRDRDSVAIGLPDAPQVQGRGDVAKNIFDRSLAMMMPAIERGNTRLLNNLQARGIPIGSEAFNDAYGDQQKRTQDTISRLALDADTAAGQEQSRLFGLDNARARFGLDAFNTASQEQSRLFGLDNAIARFGMDAFNTAGQEQSRLFGLDNARARFGMDIFNTAGQEQSRLFGLDGAARQNAIAELVAAMGGGYNPPSATPSGAAAGVNYSGLVGDRFRNDMAQFENQQAQRNATMSTLGNMAGTLLMKSSRDLKDDHGTVSIHDVAEGVTRIPIHEWTYAPGVHVPGSVPGQRHVGPMAQDFQQVFGLGDGQRINVIDAFGVCLAALKSALLRIEVLERRSFGVEVN